jgi:hypothetical protein
MSNWTHVVGVIRLEGCRLDYDPPFIGAIWGGEKGVCLSKKEHIRKWIAEHISSIPQGESPISWNYSENTESDSSSAFSDPRGLPNDVAKLFNDFTKNSEDADKSGRSSWISVIDRGAISLYGDLRWVTADEFQDGLRKFIADLEKEFSIRMADVTWYDDYENMASGETRRLFTNDFDYDDKTKRTKMNWLIENVNQKSLKAFSVSNSEKKASE